MTNNYVKYFERKALAEKIFDNNGKLTIEKRVSDAGRTTYYIVGRQEKLYNAGIYNAKEMEHSPFFEQLISKKTAKEMTAEGKAEIFDYNTVKKYYQFTFHGFEYFIISNYPTDTKAIQTRIRAASDLTHIKEELDKDTVANMLHTFNDKFITWNNPFGKVDTLGGRIIDIYGETVAYFDACGKLMANVVKNNKLIPPEEVIRNDAEYSQTFEDDCWVSPAAIEVATEAEEELATPASVTKFEVGKTYWDNSLTNHNRVFTYKVIKRTEKTVTVEDERFGKTKTYRVRIMDNHECFIAGTIESSYLTPEHIKVGEIYYSRDYQYQFVKRKIGVDQHEELNFEPVGKRNNEDIAISELVTLIADAGYTVPENIINGKDKQATLEHLTIIAEAAGVIEPIELYK